MPSGDSVIVGLVAAGAIDIDIEDVVHWIVDPYAFLARALGMPEGVPMPDVTSEGGKRLWFAHIDGDALPSWAEVPGRHLGAEMIRERILERYPLPCDGKCCSGCGGQRSDNSHRSGGAA